MLLVLRAGAFFAWLGCWCLWLCRKAKLPAAVTPLVTMCGAGVVVYAAGLLNIIWPVQLALYLALCGKNGRHCAPSSAFP